MVSGKMEITIKIKDMPDAKTTANNWNRFDYVLTTLRTMRE
jgi:hypothetical protein